MVSDSKKRKTSSTSTPTKNSAPVALTKEEVYDNAIAFEENEESHFNRNLFKDCFSELKKIIEEVKILKASSLSSEEDTKKKIAEKRIQGSMLIVKLKKLNRLDKLRLINCREILQKEKLHADSNRLKLQNLIYEADHLKKEINKCFSFKSEDEDIELVPIEEFIQNAPEESRTKEILEDEHSLRKARLGFELQQRKEYAQQCKDLEKKKETIGEQSIEVKKNLDSIYPCLKEVMKSTRPIQQILNMPFEKEWEIQKLVRLLPQPLYMAYTKLLAYAEVIDKRLTVSIEGDEEEARVTETELKQTKEEISEGEETDNEENDFDDGINHRKIKRRQSQIESLNQKRAQLFNHYPLSVKFNLNMKDTDDAFSIILNYLPELGFITVQGNFCIDSSESVTAGDVITQERVLSSLYEDDYGDMSPNPKTAFQLQNVQLNPIDLIQTLNDKKLGRPYKWAQRLCGVIFSDHYQNFNQSQKLCEETVPDLIRQIRKRIKARMLLFKQIRVLESNKIESISSYKVSSVLQLFVSLTFEEYLNQPCTSRFIEEGIVNENDVFYCAICTRGSAKLECYICIPSHFPCEAPLFSISMNWNDNKHNAETSFHIREIESFINSIENTKPEEILMQQVQRAMTSFDIYLESESTQHIENSEFKQEKNFSRSFKRRVRSRPYLAKTNMNLTSFTHL
ncbi:hypothetical protein PVAND_007217 [Polypedilum vanderplanki]|uniref:Uncharacterized protein n=1 Tax=Polypedilum vanderplanki TaxID=319348 RepID=A0A9J6C6L0_POLVA|nr:hypothetical protein PVAND_007217 [Polypedilum vanderplanki]